MVGALAAGKEQPARKRIRVATSLRVRLMCLWREVSENIESTSNPLRVFSPLPQIT
jgi:hypothetical protein